MYILNTLKKNKLLKWFLQGHPTQSALFKNAIKQRQIIFERQVQNFIKQCCGTIQSFIDIKFFLV